jgi:dipeptidyl aminopeptidase/acylaminoacyl peptidase
MEMKPAVFFSGIGVYSAKIHKRFLMLNRRIPRTILFLAVFLAAFAAFSATKRPLNHRDYDHWKTISSETLSRDGKFLAYSLFPEEGDGEIVVRNLGTGKEVHEPAGAVPDAPADAGAEEPAAGPAAARGVRLSFTYDNHFLISTTFPAKAAVDQAKKDKKPAPKGGMVIVDLATSKISRVADVASFQLAAKGESYLAYLKEATPAPTPAAAAGAEKDDEAFEDQRRAGGGRGGAGGAGANKFGADLTIRDLRVADSKGRTFADVTEFSLSKDAKALLYNVSSKKEEANGLYLVDPATDSAPAALLSGKGRYTRLTWDRDQRELVFFSDRDDAASKPSKFKLYGWARGSVAPTELISTASPHFKSGFVLADRGPVSFSRDGSRLFVSCAPAAAEPEDPAIVSSADSSDKVLADLWRWNDDYIQPMQKVRLAQERNRSYRAVYNLATKDFLQLSDSTMNTLTPSDNGTYATGADDRAYRRMVDFDGNYADIYVVNTATGDRKLALKAFKGGGGQGGGGGAAFSPDGKHLLWYKDKNWWSMSVPDGSPVNLTGNLNSAFFNDEQDTPDAPASFGNAGWTTDGKRVLLYDRHDVWSVSPDGGAAERLTNGGPSHLQFRLVTLDRADDEADRGIDPAKPLLLRAENLETRDSGFYSLARAEKGLTAKKLIMGAKAYRAITKAKDADVVLMTETTFHEQPDLLLTDSNFEAPKKVTNANPQQAELLWGTSEMISYRNDDGVQLQGVLFKPEGFDPKKKYPMIIYIYERLSQNLNTFVAPKPGHSINISYYVSNGYLVLTPDIVYTTGHPGQSALKCVLPAIEAMVEKGFVDRQHIGFQGHSWGGYQGAYLLTQTNIFAAAETGAPVANMISAYDGIRWGPGLPRQFQYEKTQSRIGGTLWERPMQFIENSPIFSLDRVTTPVMIIANDADDAVPWYQGIEMFLGLRRLGKEAYLFNYNGEPHHLNRRPNQKDYTMRMQQFFDHYLKGGPVPEWMEKGVPYMDREKEKERFANSVSEGADHKQ